MLSVNIQITKVLVFHKTGKVSNNLGLKYDNHRVETVRKFSYFGIVDLLLTCKNIVDTFIHPIPSYGCDVWRLILETSIETLNMLLMGVKRTIQNYIVFGEAGKFPLVV